MTIDPRLTAFVKLEDDFLREKTFLANGKTLLLTCDIETILSAIAAIKEMTHDPHREG